jgi:hypothetical protein
LALDVKENIVTVGLNPSPKATIVSTQDIKWENGERTRPSKGPRYIKEREEAKRSRRATKYEQRKRESHMPKKIIKLLLPHHRGQKKKTPNEMGKQQAKLGIDP